MTIIHRLKKRHILLLMLTIVLALTTTFLCLGGDSDDFRKSLENKSNADLMERGRNYYRQNQKDSALLVFTYIGDSYSPSLPLTERRLALLAKNNVGIINAFEYMDYKSGYKALADAFELADASGMEATQAVMCVNIIELLRLYGICLQTDNVAERINHYLELGIKKALEGKEYRALASMVINSLHTYMGCDITLLNAINRQEIPDTVEGVKYARNLLKATNLIMADKPKEARELIEKSYNSLPEFGRDNIDKMGHNLFVADTYAKEKNYDMAEKIANDVLVMADTLGSLQNQLITLAYLEKLPIPNSGDYAHQLLLKKDSALTKGQLQMVTEIDFRRSLNREREENKRLSEQRTRLYWGLGIGSLLLIIFGVLIGLLVRNSRKLKERNASLYAKIQEQLAANNPPAPLRTPVKKQDNADSEGNASDNSKYAGSSLSDEKMSELQNQLQELMADDSVVCDSDITLAKMASRLNVNTTYLSRVVNERFGMSFSSLLSEYRIRIASRRMSKDSPYANQTIEAISRSVGYSSRSSFIAAFKKINGMTPSEYIKLSQNLSG